jgi:apolipoprotein N-acyltransferase
LKRLKDPLFFSIAVIFYIASFPPFNLSVGAFFSLSLLFYLTYGKDRKRAILIFSLSGLLVSLFHLHWLLLLDVEPWVEKFLIIGFVLLVIYLTLYWAIFGYLFSLFVKRGFSFKLFFLLPSIWVLLEFIRSKGSMGFPWVPLWLSQIGNLPFAQIVSLIGPFGLSFLLVLFNVSLFFLYKDRKRGFKILYFLVPIYIIIFIWGVLRMERVERREKGIRVAIFQPNVLPRYIFEEGEWEETKSAYLELSERLRDTVDLIIFSESALPGFYRTSKLNKELVKRILEKNPSYIIIGSADFEREGGEFKLYNTAFLLNRRGAVLKGYNKTHLVPFGEWIPYEDHLPFLKNLDFGQGDYLPGKDLVLFDVKGFKLGTLICFESIFPEISRGYAKRGADILVNITNDGWFGRSLGPLEHFELARFRAIETGRPILRAAKTGISAYIDERGRVVEKLEMFRRGILVINLNPGIGETIYTKIGDTPIFILLLLIVLFCLVYNLKNSGGRG